MRVLHVHSGNLFGGVESFLTTLARHRRACPGMVPHFALCFAGRMSRELQAARAEVHALGSVRMSRPGTLGRARMRLSDTCRRAAVDVVVAHSPWSLVLVGSVARDLGLPLALWLHNPMRRAPLDWWARRSTPDVVIANSRFTAQSIPPKLQEAPVHVVYGPVPPPGPPNAARREAIRRELATPAAAVVVVMAARFEPWKGHLTLLHALARLRHLSGWLGWVVGGPQRRTELRYSDTLSRTAARLGLADRIRFCGERTDVPSVLQAADLYCQPNSEAEPFGVALVEAMAAGLPVITTGLGGATEIVSDRCGRLVSRGDASSVAAAIETLLGAPERRLRLGRCGRARARVLCDPSQQLQRLHDVLRSSIRSRVDA